MAIGTYILIITLNVNGLNTPTKRHTMAEWIQKQDPYICCLQETHFRPQDTYRLKLRGQENIYYANFMTNLDSILKRRDITLPTKVRLVKAMVFPVVMYGCESWTVKKAECRRIDAFELWCWRRLLRVPWTARRSNPSI